MNIEYNILGKFYQVTTGSGSFLEQTDTESLLGEVMCDVQQDKTGFRSAGDAIFFLYSVYADSIPDGLKEGDIFRCNMYGKNIDGIILSFWKHSLGVELKIKDRAIDG